MTFLVISLYPALLSNLYGQVTESFTTSDDETLFYQMSGQGSQIVLLYGGPGLSAEAMQHWADTLSNQNECVLLHQRGTGKSKNVKINASTINLRRAVEDIEDLRKHLGKRKVTLCGFSWGGGLAQAYAATYPKNVRRLILVASLGPDLSLLTRFSKNINARTTRQVADSLRYWNQQPDTPESARKRMMYTFLPYFNNQEVGRKVLASIPFEIQTQVSMYMWNDLRKNYRLNSRLPNYKGKCYIIRPMQDVIPEGMTVQIQQKMPQSKLLEIDQCGHFPDLECPDKFFNLLKGCL